MQAMPTSADTQQADTDIPSKQSAFFYTFPDGSPQHSAASGLALGMQDCDPSALQASAKRHSDNEPTPGFAQVPVNDHHTAAQNTYTDINQPEDQYTGDVMQLQADVAASGSYPPLTDLLAELWHTDGPLAACQGSTAEQVLGGKHAQGLDVKMLAAGLSESQVTQ